MKKLLNRMKDIGEAVLDEIVEFFLSFGGTGVMLALTVVLLLLTFFGGLKILESMGAFV